MPRVFGVNIVAVAAAAVAMFFVGFVFYGLVFQEMWLRDLVVFRGLVPAADAPGLDMAAMTERLAAVIPPETQGPAMALGFLISLALACGLGVMLRATGVRSLGDALMRAGGLWALFAAPTLAYDAVYAGEGVTTLVIDLGHNLVGYLVGAALIFLIDRKAFEAA